MIHRPGPIFTGDRRCLLTFRNACTRFMSGPFLEDVLHQPSGF